MNITKAFELSLQDGYLITPDLEEKVAYQVRYSKMSATEENLVMDLYYRDDMTERGPFGPKYQITLKNLQVDPQYILKDWEVLDFRPRENHKIKENRKIKENNENLLREMQGYYESLTVRTEYPDWDSHGAAGKLIQTHDKEALKTTRAKFNQPSFIPEGYDLK